MKIEIIKPTTIVAETCAILMRLASALDQGGPDATVATVAADHELREWMEPHESAVLVALVTEERRRCLRCSKAASYTRCSGPVCLACAAAIRNERLNNEWEQA